MLMRSQERDITRIPGEGFTAIPKTEEITFTKMIFALVKAGSVIDEFWQAQQIARQIIFDPFPELQFRGEREARADLATQGLSCLCWSAVTVPEVIVARVEVVRLGQLAYFRYRDNSSAAADYVYSNTRLWWERLPVLQADLKYSGEMTGGEDRTITMRLPRKWLGGYQVVTKTV